MVFRLVTIKLQRALLADGAAAGELFATTFLAVARADFFAVTLLVAAAFLAIGAGVGAAFLETALFFDTGAFLATAAAFWTAFLAIATFFPGALLALGATPAFFARLMGAVAAGSADVAPTRNASRFFAPAIQAGARPKPLHVFPVFGSA